MIGKGQIQETVKIAGADIVITSLPGKDVDAFYAIWNDAKPDVDGESGRRRAVAFGAFKTFTVNGAPCYADEREALKEDMPTWEAIQHEFFRINGLLAPKN